jgi:hypothetical protein
VKVKLYPWIEVSRNTNCDGWSLAWTLNLLPALRVERDFYDLGEDPRWPGIGKGGRFTAQFCWLLFGVTFDFLFGDEAVDG